MLQKVTDSLLLVLPTPDMNNDFFSVVKEDASFSFFFEVGCSERKFSIKVRFLIKLLGLNPMYC